jgi:asparagine synthase (glutamine-hydrolysing)
MCGIAGAVNFDNKLTSENTSFVKSMSNCMLHRGPDAGGFFSDSNVALAHRRLSIIDLDESSNQPMQSSDDQVIIVFNGEIYNHEDLRKKLEDKHIFKTKNSDTEVIINAYKEWGIKCLDKFVGMFAFAIYDVKNEKVFLVRDRLGKKPLYYTVKNNTLYFSSENQAFFDAKLQEKAFNDESIYHYLTYLTTPAPDTFYKDVYKLEAGYYCEISIKNKLEKTQYWNISDFINKENSATAEEAYLASNKLLEDSMYHRNVADVPISIALSGGLDSSLNLFYTKKIRSDKVSTINIKFDTSTKGDESHIARKYSEENNVNFIHKVLDETEFTSWIKDYLNISKDVPAGDPNTALMFGISRIARENNYKVLLVGEGGDEIGGYPIYKKLDYLNKIMKFIPDFLSKWIVNFASWVPHNNLTKKIIRVFSVPTYANRFIFGFTEFEKRKFWTKKKKFNSYKTLKKLADEIRDDLKDSYLRKVLNIEYKLRLPELLLPRVDYPSMAASIEARSPFMDHKLIEYSATLPWEIKMENGPKTILKKISKNKLPEYIIKAPKVGFGQLLNPFFEETLPQWFERDIVKDNKSPIKDYIDQDFLHNLHKKHIKSKLYGFQIWTIFSLNLWMKKNQQSND